MPRNRANQIDHSRHPSIRRTPPQIRSSVTAADGGTSLSALCAKALRYPFLSAEKENELINAWREQADMSALNELVGSHLRLVIKIARGYRGYGLPM